MPTTENESRHYSEAEKWLERAENAWDDPAIGHESVARMQKFAELHYLAAAAADVDRHATAADRVAECVPDGGSRLQVAVPR